jgi:hypothetical protein
VKAGITLVLENERIATVTRFSADVASAAERDECDDHGADENVPTRVE